MTTMFCRTPSRFPRVFKPLYNMEACFRNNPKLFTQQINCKSESISKENPYMKKYAEKIAAFQNSCPEEYNKRTEQLKISAKAKNNKFVKKQNPSEKKDMSEPQSSSKCSYQKKSLNEIMKLELLKDKPTEEIEMIWKNYHKDKSGLYAILPSEAFQKILSTSIECPTFLLPLPKAEGCEFIMCQFTRNSCYFTQLINYQTHKENAPVCLTITYYSELQDDKGIVLMRGEFDENVMKPHEAQCLSNQLQLYYGGNCSRKRRILQNFNKNPNEFKHMDLVKELELSA